jgi:hypothetical protein
MFELIDHHYLNVTPARFEADLDEKDWVIVIEDDVGTLQGFTTFRMLSGEWEGEPIAAVYSGDTLFSPNYMGERGWLSVWGRHVFEMGRSLPVRDLYWVFLAASHRAYQFLPGFFEEFYPHPERPTPASMSRILEIFIRQKYDDPFDPTQGLLTLRSPTPYRYPDHVAAQVPGDDPFARFFLQKNPGYLAGDLLACITKLSFTNVTRVGWRVLGPELANNRPPE